MEYKTCSNPECTEVNPQPIGNFYRNRHASDELDNRCKTCRNAYYKEYRKTEHGRQRIRLAANKYAASTQGREKQRDRQQQDSYKEKKRQYYREYSQRERSKELVRKRARRFYHSKKGRQTYRRYMQTEHGRKLRNAASYAYRKRHPERYSAQQAVCYAVRVGKLPPISDQSCRMCGKQAEHYHHPNGYDDEHRLDVIPLCANCHTQAHQNNTNYSATHSHIALSSPVAG